MMQFKVRNIIKYQFSKPVSYGVQRLRLSPLTSTVQKVADWNIKYVGAKEQLAYLDHNGNLCRLITFLPNTTEVVINLSGFVQTFRKNNFILRHTTLCPIWLYQNETLFTTAGKKISEFCRNWLDSQLSRMCLCREIALAIKNEMEYRIGQTNTKTTAEQAFKLKSGVCQDFAHVFIACMRSLNIPARYVSGYLKIDNVKIQTATHGWAEAFIDKYGWVGFDIANNIDIDDRYIMLATGSDFVEANPINGLLFNSENEEVTNQIEIKRYKFKESNQ